MLWCKLSYSDLDEGRLPHLARQLLYSAFVSSSNEIQIMNHIDETNKFVSNDSSNQAGTNMISSSNILCIFDDSGMQRFRFGYMVGDT